MKKISRLKESDIERLIHKILKEQPTEFQSQEDVNQYNVGDMVYLTCKNQPHFLSVLKVGPNKLFADVYKLGNFNTKHKLGQTDVSYQPGSEHMNFEIKNENSNDTEIDIKQKFDSRFNCVITSVKKKK